MLIDTHSHLFFDDYDEDRDEVIRRAQDAGVKIMISIGIDLDSSQRAIALAKQHSCIHATVGIHPHSANLADEAFYRDVEALIRPENRVVAIGEVGLDYFKSEVSVDEQQRAFMRMAEMAGRHRLPLVVHSREAFEDTFKILKHAKAQYPGLKALFHCYTYGPDEMERIVAEGFLVSFSGIVTFKNAVPIQEAARRVPEHAFVIETDCPYLTPPPHRGKRNEPAFVRIVAEKIAELKGVDVPAIERLTTQNAERLFGVSAS